MEISKTKMKQILLIITFTLLLFTMLINLSLITSFISFILNLLMPLILGGCIAFIVNMILVAIETKLLKNKTKKIWIKIKRPLSLILALLTIFLVIFMVFFLVIPELKNTVMLFIDNYPTYQKSIISFINSLNLDQNTINTIQTAFNTIIDNITLFFKNNYQELINTTLNVTSTIFTTILNFILGIVFAIYILLEKETFLRQTKKIIYTFFKKEKANKILNIGTISYQNFAKFLSGQFIEAIIIGLLCFIGMLILKIPYAPTISILVGFTALIPVFGAFIGTAIGAFLILMISPIKAIIFIIFIIILQQLEGNLIYPKVVGKSVGLPGIWVMLAVLVGGSLNGIVGMFLAVPIAAIIYSLFRTYVNEQLKNKKINI